MDNLVAAVHGVRVGRAGVVDARRAGARRRRRLPEISRGQAERRSVVGQLRRQARAT
jgi:hypothetical protein